MIAGILGYSAVAGGLSASTLATLAFVNHTTTSVTTATITPGWLNHIFATAYITGSVFIAGLAVAAIGAVGLYTHEVTP